MAMARTKTVNRRSLASQKEPEGAATRLISKKPNMINVTGEEANGLQISPNTVTLFFFLYVGVIIFLHKFIGDKIPYGVPKHMLSHLRVPDEVVEE